MVPQQFKDKHGNVNAVMIDNVHCDIPQTSAHCKALSLICIDIPLICHRLSTIFNRFALMSTDLLSILIDFHVISTDFREAQKRGIRGPQKIRMAYNSLEGTWRDFAPKKGQWFVIISNRR